VDQRRLLPGCQYLLGVKEGRNGFGQSTARPPAVPNEGHSPPQIGSGFSPTLRGAIPASRKVALESAIEYEYRSAIHLSL